ncbi:MAG: hypothetical protein AAF667_16675 [Pseudomonadota bacterium]
MKRLLTFLSSCSALVGSAALACSFHNYVPRPTMVDRLLNTEHIVLARADPDDPLRFQPLQALEGEADLVDLPFLVDAATRQRLNADPQAKVLFTRDGAYGEWLRVAYVDAEMSAVLNTVMEHRDAWQIGEDDDRFATFAGYLDHPDRAVRHLALRELDRADYGVLRQLDPKVDTANTLSALSDPAEADLVPIRYLLLGLAGDAALEQKLRAGLSDSLNRQNGVLGAKTVALLELGGAARAEELARSFLSNSDVPLADREMMVEAFALLSIYGAPDMQVAVRTSVAAAIQAAPDIGAPVARQFGGRGDWSMHETLEAAVRDRRVTSPLEVILLSQYVAIANETLEPGSN